MSRNTNLQIAMTLPTTIVFGPTGSVGSAAARTALRLGAKVVLAMRDPQKPIPGLISSAPSTPGRLGAPGATPLLRELPGRLPGFSSAEQPPVGSFERVKADLAQPESVRAAVQSTGATHAFLYLAHGTPDHMRATVEALKAAGVSFVVFLSSVEVQGDPRRTTLANPVAFIHGQVEAVLDEVFGPDGYIALRPCSFASKSQWWVGMIPQGEVQLGYPDMPFDWISSEDVGRAAGTVLTQGMQATGGAAHRNSIYLSGPTVASQREFVGLIGKALGVDIKVTELDDQAAVEKLVESGMPQLLAKALTNNMAVRNKGEAEHDLCEPARVTAAVANLRKFAGRASTLEEWVEENRGIFKT